MICHIPNLYLRRFVMVSVQRYSELKKKKNKGTRKLRSVGVFVFCDQFLILNQLSTNMLDCDILFS